MSLTASMWTGVSGLLAHGDRMNVIGNNISNVNTVGFKGQRMDFADFVYQDSFSLSGMTQIGRGVRIGAVMGEFGQGSFETTTETTDLAIGGNGFFRVEPIGSETAYYTRAGNFRFNENGYLVDPNGYCVQGWKVDNTTGPTRASGGMSTSIEDTTSSIIGSGSPTDVRLDKWTVDPLQTTKVSMMVNLSKDKGADKMRDPENPFASLLSAWNGTQPQKPNVPYISEDAYSYQTSIDVYDEAGGTHTLTVYFDQVSSEDYIGSSGKTMWEYMITMDPSEDLRQVAVPDPTAAGGYTIKDMKDTAAGGLLMSGTLTFDSAGRLENQSAYVLNGSREPQKDPVTGAFQNANGYITDRDNNPIPVLDPENIADFMYPTEVSSAGFPMLVANFTGIPGSHTVGSVPDADKYLMEIDFGLKVSDYADPWKNADSLGSLRYPTVDNPMINGTTGLQNPASTATPPETLPVPSRGLTLGDVHDNGEGKTPRYVYENPDYKSDVAGSPPYVYADQAALNAAWQRALANARVRTGFNTTDKSNADMAALVTKADWPAAAVAGGTATVNGETVNLGAITDANFGNFTYQAPDGSTIATTNGAKTPPMAEDVASIKPPAYRQPNAFTSYKGGHLTQTLSQNGYGFGNLSNYTVDSSGVLYGIYSNGVNLPLYQLTLYDFTCKQGLRREGNNLFSQTRDSGDPSSGAAGTGLFGTVNANTLEGSNVDLSTEFVRMITTQRGFQSNSKVVTTTDTMLETVINMKR